MSDTTLQGQPAPARSSRAARPGSWLDRTQNITWPWFTLSMSTGGIAILLNSLVHRFRALDTLGTIVYIANLVFFLALVVGITLRFATHPGSLRRSLTNPSELFFLPTALLSVSTILAGAAEYGQRKSGPWLGTTLQVFFWIHVAVCLAQSWFTYLIIFSSRDNLKIAEYTPGWIMPFLPLMLLGTVAGSLVPLCSPEQALTVAVAGVVLLGMGFLLALVDFALYLFRLSIYGLPPPSARPAMFIAVGPPSFTSYALLKLASSSSRFVTDQTLHPAVPNLSAVIETTAVLFGLLIWGLALWFFALALVCNLSSAWKRKLHFSVVWWSFVFPNVGWTISTNELGRSLGSEGITWLAVAMALLLVTVWLSLLLRFAVGLLSGSLLRLPVDKVPDEMERLRQQSEEQSTGDRSSLGGAERA